MKKNIALVYGKELYMWEVRSVWRWGGGGGGWSVGVLVDSGGKECVGGVEGVE